MDIIHSFICSFISDVLLHLILSDNYQFYDKQPIVDQRYYDVDIYITRSEKKLNRMISEHLQAFFTEDTSIEQYYKILDNLSTNPRILHDMRIKLESIFPFMQRMTNPQVIVIQYIHLIETLHDTMMENRIKALLPIKSKRSSDANADVDYNMVNSELNTQSESNVLNDKERALASVDTQTLSILDNIEDKIPTFDSVQNKLSNANDDESYKTSILDDESLKSENTDNEVSSNNSVVDNSDDGAVNIQTDKSPIKATINSDDEIKSIISETQPKVSQTQTTRKQASSLGIKIKGNSLEQLLIDFENGTISPKNLSRKGMVNLILRKNPTAAIKNKSRKQLEALLELDKVNIV